MKRRLFAVLMTLALVCALPIWVVLVTSGDVTNALVSTAWADPLDGNRKIFNTTVYEHYEDKYPKLAYQLDTSETEVCPGLFWVIKITEDEDAWEDGRVHYGTIDITDAAGTTHAVSISYRAEKGDSPEGEYADSYPEGMSKLFIAIEPQAYNGLESGTYSLEWMRAKYTGSKLTYTGTTTDQETGMTIIDETRDEYYTRTHYEAQLTIAKSAPSASYRYYPTVTAVLNGPNKSATDYSGGIYGLIFRSGTYFGSFQGIQVDGKTIAAANYTAEDNGGTEIYLKAVYLQTLAAGQHTLTILSSAGDVTAEFTVNGGNSSPKTFDAGITVYAGMALLSLTGMSWVGKKKF